MTTPSVRRLVTRLTTVACAVTLGVTAPMTTAVAAPSAHSSAVVHRAGAAEVTFADRLVRRLVKRVNAGDRKAARKVAEKDVVVEMFRARKDGFRFAKPRDDCQYRANKQGYDCSTSIVLQGVLQGSAFFFAPAETSSPAVTKVSLAFGE